MSGIVLASASPRRAELLESAGVSFVVVPSTVEEEQLPGEGACDFVRRLARDKAMEVAGRHPGRIFVGADTVVVCDDEILGKPVDDDDAVRMLRMLSGRTHQVVTGFCVFERPSGKVVDGAVVTDVTFIPLREEEIAAYVATGCPRDKAGAYAIQGGAAYMVERIAGSYTNVVGLPLAEVVRVLRSMGVGP